MQRAGVVKGEFDSGAKEKDFRSHCHVMPCHWHEGWVGSELSESLPTHPPRQELRL